MIAAVALVIIQFFQIDKTSPSVIATQDFIQNTNPPAEIATLLKTCLLYTSPSPRD